MTCKLISPPELPARALRHRGDIYMTSKGRVFLLASVYHKDLKLYGLYDVCTGRAWSNLSEDISTLKIPLDATVVAPGSRITLEVTE